MRAKIVWMVGTLSLLLSCKKEKDTGVEEAGNTIAGKERMAGSPAAVLSFTSYEQYDGFVSNREEVAPPEGFVSLRSVIEELDNQRNTDEEAYLGNPHLPDTLYESYGRLLDVLNEDKIVDLNGHLVRVDLYEGKVYSINSTSQASYELLVSETTSPEVTVESTDEEVALRIFRIGRCRDRGVPPRSKDGDKSCDNRHRTKKDIAYQKAGIYFSLVAEAKSQQRFLRVWWDWRNNPTISETSFSWEQRCGNTMNWSGTAWLFDYSTYNSNAHRVAFRPYENTKALRTFYFKATLNGCGGGTDLDIKP